LEGALRAGDRRLCAGGVGATGDAGCRGVATGGARLRRWRHPGAHWPRWACVGLATRSRQLGLGSAEG
jgi:hypothetical protein